MADDTIRLGLDVNDVVTNAKRASEALHQVTDVSAGYDLLTAAQQEAERAAGKFADEIERTNRWFASQTDVFGNFKRSVESAGNAYKVLERNTATLVNAEIQLAGENRKLAETYDVIDAAMDREVAAAVRRTQATNLMRQSLADVPASNVRLAATTAAVGAGMDDASRKSMTFGRSVLQTSYAVQDFTATMNQGLGRALGSVQNNIPLLVDGLVGGVGLGAAQVAGISGAVSIVSVGVGLLVDHWDQLTAAWDKSEPKIPKLRSDLEGVGDTLSEVDAKIKELTEKSTVDVLSHQEQVLLGRLNMLRGEVKNALDDQKLVEGVASTNESETSKQRRADVKSAIGAAGGGASVAANLMDNMGTTYKEAVAVVADAMRGSEAALKTLRENTKGFSESIADVERNRRNQEEQDRHQRQMDAREQRKADAKNAADAAASRRKRLSGYAAEDAENEKSTPDEERLSAAMTAIENRRGSPGRNWTDAEWMQAAQFAVKARDAGASGRDAITGAIRGINASRGKTAGAAADAGLAADVENQAGGQLDASQLQAVVNQAKGYMATGADQNAAVAQSLLDLLDAIRLREQRAMAESARMNGVAQQVRFTAQQVRANAQRQSSFMPRSPMGFGG